MAVNRRSKGDIRMGPISVIVMVVLLCLSVLAVLAASTAQANYLEANKQARFVNSTYANERAAQEYLATVDASLAKSKEARHGKAAAIDDLREVLPSEVAIDGDEVAVAFVGKDGRTLSVAFVVNDDLTYSTTRWKATTRWEPDTSSGTLWKSN